MNPGRISFADGRAEYAPRGLPAKHTLDYCKVALELLLLLLAVPWIVRELTKHPGELSKKAAGKHLAGP